MKNLLAASLLICLLNSCYGPGVPDPYIVPDDRQKENRYYAPSAPNAPLLKKQYDLTGGFRISSGTQFTVVDMQTAYMPGKHFGIGASYNFKGNLKSNNNFKTERGEIGAGYIMSIDSNFHFESYAGFGSGQINNIHYTGSSLIKNDYFFLQPAIVVSSDDGKVRFAFVSKFVGNQFHVGNALFDHAREPLSASQIELIQNKPFHFLWEPGFVFRFGGEHVVFHVGYSFSKDITSSDLLQATYNFSAGLSLKFNAFKQPIK
ncbi:MAG: hypothetical protein QM726_17165 [Chitinophagaceae bacterium]